MSKAEVIRCLKRYVAREVFSVLRNSPGSSAVQLDIYRSIRLFVLGEVHRESLAVH